MEVRVIMNNIFYRKKFLLSLVFFSFICNLSMPLIGSGENDIGIENIDVISDASDLSNISDIDLENYGSFARSLQGAVLGGAVFVAATLITYALVSSIFVNNGNRRRPVDGNDRGGNRDDVYVPEFSNPHKITKCGICKKTFNDGERISTIVGCDHAFCRTCIVGKVNRDHECPVCKDYASDYNITNKKFKKLNDRYLREFSNPRNVTTCEVCKRNFSDGQRVAVLGCNHAFHRDCVLSKVCCDHECPTCLRYTNQYGLTDKKFKRLEPRGSSGYDSDSDDDDDSDSDDDDDSDSDDDDDSDSDDLLGLSSRKSSHSILARETERDWRLLSRWQLNGELKKACRDGNLQKVKYLVENRRVEIKITDHIKVAKDNYKHIILGYLRRKFKQNNRNLLETACRSGDLQKVKDLVEIAEYSVRTDLGRSMYYIILRNRASIARYLIEKGVRVTLKHLDDTVGFGNNGVATVIYNSVCRNRGEETFTQAIRNGWNNAASFIMDRQPWDKNRLLREACIAGNLRKVKFLVEQKGANINARNQTSNSPLDLACARGHLDVVRYLVVQRRDNPEKTDRDGLRPLHYAARKGQLRVVQYLVNERKVDVNAETRNRKKKPLDYAGRHNSVKEFLISKGAGNIFESDEEECPICMDYEFADNKEIIKLPCNHIFCDGCIRNWVVQQNNGNCPICRREGISRRDLKKHLFKKKIT